MISDAETVRANEYVRRRILRLQQVREQSKNIAKKIRSKVNEEKNRQITNIESASKQEFESFRRKTIDHLKSDFDNRLSGIGGSHAAAIDEDLAEIEWNIQKQINTRLATDRGSRATSRLEREKTERNAKRVLPRKQSARYVTRKLPSNLKKKPSTTTSNGLQEFYLEANDPDNQCANLSARFEINTETQSSSTSPAKKSRDLEIIHEETETNKSSATRSPNKARLQINAEPQIIFQEDIAESPDNDSDDIPQHYEEPVCVNIDSNNINIVPPRITPAETLRQLKITEKHSADSTSKSSDDPFQRQFNTYLSAIPEEPNSLQTASRQPTSKSLQAMSNDNPFNAISDYIKHRQLDGDRRPSRSHSNKELNDADTMKDLIHYARHAQLSTGKPLIPTLPENYKRFNERNSEKECNARKKQHSDLLAASADWIPSSTRCPYNQASCRCPSSCCSNNRNVEVTKCIAGSKPLRGILSQSACKQSCSSANRNIKYVTGKPSVRSKPFIPGSKCCNLKGKPLLSSGVSKKSRTSPVRKNCGDSKCRANVVKSYDQNHKFAKDFLVDSQKFVERHPKEKKNAFELAKEENLETDRATSGLNDYFIDEARRIRGERAMEKVLVDKDCINMKKELDALTRDQRLYGRKLPETAYMFEERLKEKERLRQKRMEEAYEEAMRPTKVLRHPVPVNAPVVNPERSPKKRRSLPQQRQRSESEVSSSDALQRRSHGGREPKRMISSVNVGSWDVGSIRSLTDDLDEIPTRDSDGTVNSVACAEKKRPVKPMSIDRVLDLVEKQKEQLIREVVRMKTAQNEKTTRSNSPKFVERSKSPKVRERSENPKIRERSKSPKKVSERSKSPKKVSEGSKSPKKISERSKSPKKVERKLQEQQSESDDSCSTEEFKKPPTNKRLKKKVKSVSPKKAQDPRSASANSDKICAADSRQKVQMASAASSISLQGLQILIEVKKTGSQKETVLSNAEKSKSVKVQEEHKDSSTEMSITASQFVSKKTTFIESNNSVLRFDSSESTAYMSPPEKFTSKAMKTLFGPAVMCKNSETQTNNNAKSKKSSKSNGDRDDYEWEAVHPDAIKQLAEARRRDVSESSKSERFYETESTISREVSVNRVSSLSQNDASRKSSAEKGIQVSSSLRMSSQSLSQHILKEPNRRIAPELDPKLKMYVRQLLEMSKAGVSKFNVDVSDVSTPSTSVINISSNLPPQLNPKLCDKVEKLKTFIDENYTLLEEFGKENNFDRNYRYKHVAVSNSKSPDKPKAAKIASTRDKKSARYCEQVEASAKSPKKTKKNAATPKKSSKNQEKNQKVKDPVITHSKSPPVEELPVKKIPAKVSPRLEINLDDECLCDEPRGREENAGSSRKVSPKHTSPSKKLKTNDREDRKSIEKESESNVGGISRNRSRSKSPSKTPSTESSLQIVSEHSSPPPNDKKQEKYVQLSAECSERINNLSQMLEQIRKDKQATLSSSSSPFSDDGKLNLSKKQPLETSSDSIDIGYVPLLAGIPKPPNNDLNNVIITSGAWEYHVPPIRIKEASNVDSDDCLRLESFDNSCESPEKRPKPPAALRRHPMMRNIDANPCSPHELSTIAEVDTPITNRNNSAQSRLVELSPSSVKSTKNASAKDKNQLPCVYYDYTGTPKNFTIKKDLKILPKVNYEGAQINTTNEISKPVVEVEVILKPFLSFQDYVKRSSEDVIDLEADDNLGDSTLKVNENGESSSLSSDDTLPDIIPEMIKRNLMRKPDNSTSNCSVENSTSSSPINSSPPIAIPLKTSPTKSRRRRTELETAINKNLQSISGVQAFGDTSNSSISERSTSELEKALRSMGIGWGVSTLKKTKETNALSSSSSSMPKEKRQPHKSPSESLQKSKDMLAELANMSGTSVGLSTLLEELNITDDFVYKANSSANASRISLNKELEVLLHKIEAVRSAIKPKQKSAKSNEKKTVQLPKEGGDFDQSGRKLLKSDLEQNSGRRSLKGGGNPSVKVNLFSEEASLSGLQGSRDKTHQRTSTPVQVKSLSHSSSTASSSHRASNGLFGMESDLSSVKNISNVDMSAAEKDTLCIPNMSLKFGKLFDSTIKSDICNYK